MYVCIEPHDKPPTTKSPLRWLLPSKNPRKKEPHYIRSCGSALADEAVAHWTFKIPAESQRNNSGYSCKQARIQKERLGGESWMGKGASRRRDAEGAGTPSASRGLGTGTDSWIRPWLGNGEDVSLHSQLGIWESVVNSRSGIRGRAPAENGFQCFLSVTERLSLRRVSYIDVLSE